MDRSLTLFAFLVLLPSIAQALAWNREAKSYYLLSETLLPSSYTSTAGTASIKSTQASYKTYLEYGLTPKWMIIAELSGTTIGDNLTINAIQPYNWQGRINLPYQQYSGRIGLSYQIGKENNRALSAQIFYRPGDFLHRKGNQEYVKNSEEISLGITKGMSYKFNTITDIYMEMGYTPSLYYRANKYSPETRVNLGLNLNNKFNFEIGMWHKMDAANVKNSPYTISYDDMPHHFGYVATDIHSLIKIKNYHNLTTLHFKASYQINKSNGIEFGVYRHSKGDETAARTVYSIGYVLRG